MERNTPPNRRFAFDMRRHAANCKRKIDDGSLFKTFLVTVVKLDQ